VTTEQIFLIVLLWGIPLVLAVWMGSQKSRRGLLYGLFGWVGVFVLAYLGDNPRGQADSLYARGRFMQCPYCGLLTPAESRSCRNCNRVIAASP
jgi:hypothetical protein